MSIKFLCPNGHKLRCKDDRAGRAARCPECGVKFYVPQISEVRTYDSKLKLSRPQQPGGSSTSQAATEEQLEFLCPNGHRLATAVNLQGTPGQCPVCGSKFRIPTRDEIFDAGGEKPDEHINLRAAGDSSMDIQEFGEMEGELEGELPGDDEAAGPTTAGADSDSGRPASPAAGPPLVTLFSWLWSSKSPSAVIELHLRNGEKIIPDRFARKLSQGSHGVFVIDESNGTHTVTVVAWDSIARVLVRGIRRLPQTLAE